MFKRRAPTDKERELIVGALAEFDIMYALGKIAYEFMILEGSGTYTVREYGLSMIFPPTDARILKNGTIVYEIKIGKEYGYLPYLLDSPIMPPFEINGSGIFVLAKAITKKSCK